MEERNMIRREYKITYEELETKFGLKGKIKAVHDTYDENSHIRIETEE